MNKIIISVILSLIIAPVFALETAYEKEMPVQKRINEIGFKILNANALDKHVVFSYNKKEKLLKNDSAIKRQIVLYDTDLKQAENDDELAAELAREISFAMKSYDGSAKGLMSTAQIKMSPKKYELYADKRAADFMVKAGYNPLALITLINKTYPQARQDKFSKHNLTSKRLMYIYERIYYNYPHFLVDNTYTNNEYYQNFLLTSVSNRKKLFEAARRHERGKIKYE
ncbi:MAG: hypothetical protein LUE64_01735 [Candidatus Gastranaerophilales bacterium]|nr:hypothetical protein [Candidatus Gastranaerophilales bacterium]